jgi:hypothetical protein
LHISQDAHCRSYPPRLRPPRTMPLERHDPSQKFQHQSRQICSGPRSGPAEVPYFVPEPELKLTSSLADRPYSIEELARIAHQDAYDRYGDTKQDLRSAEVYLIQGKQDLKAGKLQLAFVHFARTATLVLQKMPTNSQYHQMKKAHRLPLSDVSVYFSSYHVIGLTLAEILCALSTSRTVNFAWRG